MARKGSRSEWQKPGMLSHQKCSGMAHSYMCRRASYSHFAERRGDLRLWQWIVNYKPFLKWGKLSGDTPCK